MRQGRPLRFLALTLGGWIGVRAVLLSPVPAADAPVPTRPTGTRASDLKPVPSNVPDQGAGMVLERSANRPAYKASWSRAHHPAKVLAAAPAMARPAADPLVLSPPKTSPAPTQGSIAQVHRPRVEPRGNIGPPKSASRWHGDTWLVARPSGGEPLAFGQLGASQAGMRLTYDLDHAGRLAASGRVSAPLSGRGREAALGLDWQPTSLPVHLLIEQRVPLDGGAARPAAQLIAGTATRLTHGFTLEAYAQAGAVHRRGGFADGAARLARPLFTSRMATLDLGAGGWGAVQRDVARLDIGPTLGVTLPARGGTVRLGLDYRVRVAGRARPGSGPALTLGSSF